MNFVAEILQKTLWENKTTNSTLFTGQQNDKLANYEGSRRRQSKYNLYCAFSSAYIFVLRARPESTVGSAILDLGGR